MIRDRVTDNNEEDTTDEDEASEDDYTTTEEEDSGTTGDEADDGLRRESDVESIVTTTGSSDDYDDRYETDEQGARGDEADTLSTHSDASQASFFSLSELSATEESSDDASEDEPLPSTPPHRAASSYDTYEQVPRIFWAKSRWSEASVPPHRASPVGGNRHTVEESSPWSTLRAKARGAGEASVRPEQQRRPYQRPPAGQQQRRIDPLRYGSMFPNLCPSGGVGVSGTPAAASWLPRVYSAHRGYDHDDWRTLCAYYRNATTPCPQERNLVTLSDAQLCRTYSRAQLKGLMLRFHPDKAEAEQPQRKRAHKILFQKVFRVYKQLTGSQ